MATEQHPDRITAGKAIFPSTNFTSTNTVVLQYPISTVFPIIGTSEGHNRVVRLSSLCSQSDTQQRESVALPRGASLATASVRTDPAADPNDAAFSNTILLPRQHFTLTEEIPVLFSLVTKSVHIEGTLTWDESARIALYESQTNLGVTIWKLRRFYETKEGGTKIVETIEGNCAAWMKHLVQGQTRKAHRDHMELYHTLFESSD